MVAIYKHGKYKIFSKSNNSGYVVWNTFKPYETGHVDVDNFKFGAHLIDLSINRKIPNQNKKHIMNLLTTISDDDKYISKLKNLSKK